jgi:Protein of unknown function (DUF2934)
MEVHMKPKKPISDEVKREIEVRAYLIWEREGHPIGRELEHWKLAEAEILAVAPEAKTEKKAARSNGKPAANGVAKVVAAAKAKKPAKPKAAKPSQHHS